MPTVPQTSVIFFSLLVGFVVFITIKGELSGYLYVIGLGGGAPGVCGGAGTSGTGTGTANGVQPDGSICVDGKCSVMVPITPKPTKV